MYKMGMEILKERELPYCFQPENEQVIRNAEKLASEGKNDNVSFAIMKNLRYVCLDCYCNWAHVMPVRIVGKNENGMLLLEEY